jgi:hypothetical protein
MSTDHISKKLRTTPAEEGGHAATSQGGDARAVSIAAPPPAAGAVPSPPQAAAGTATGGAAGTGDNSWEPLSQPVPVSAYTGEDASEKKMSEPPPAAQSWEPLAYVVTERVNRKGANQLSGNPLMAVGQEHLVEDPEAKEKRGRANWFSPVDFRSPVMKESIPKDYLETRPLPTIPLEEVEAKITDLLSGKVDAEGNRTPWDDISFYGQENVVPLLLSYLSGKRDVLSRGNMTIYPTQEAADAAARAAGLTISWSGVMTAVLSTAPDGKTIIHPVEEDRVFMTSDQKSRIAHGHHQPPTLPSGPLLLPNGEVIPDKTVGEALVAWKKKKKKPVLIEEDGSPDLEEEVAFARAAALEVKDQHFVMYVPREGRKRDHETKQFAESIEECFHRHLSEEFGLYFNN